jgi:hypothetical protein
MKRKGWLKKRSWIKVDDPVKNVKVPFISIFILIK